MSSFSKDIEMEYDETDDETAPPKTPTEETDSDESPNKGRKDQTTPKGPRRKKDTQKDIPDDKSTSSTGTGGKRPRKSAGNDEEDKPPKKKGKEVPKVHKFLLDERDTDAYHVGKITNIPVNNRPKFYDIYAPVKALMNQKKTEADKINAIKPYFDMVGDKAPFFVRATQVERRSLTNEEAINLTLNKDTGIKLEWVTKSDSSSKDLEYQFGRLPKADVEILINTGAVYVKRDKVIVTFIPAIKDQYSKRVLVAVNGPPITNNPQIQAAIRAIEAWPDVKVESTRNGSMPPLKQQDNAEGATTTKRAKRKEVKVYFYLTSRTGTPLAVNSEAVGEAGTYVFETPMPCRRCSAEDHYQTDCPFEDGDMPAKF
ncbi:hypothetical protein CVT24_013031 [Panaeolus cyanescens]|uniref:CCHC-type domain-containing protein n=1 Tax=Panaeolus cyanescens TaxID=181874 RepID=A0A409X2B6_9AGAR|nr:hypothetical protein CVT24_013031 [Panaeolus cyanescens]